MYTLFKSCYRLLLNTKSDLSQVIKFATCRSNSKNVYIGDSHIWYIASETNSTKLRKIYVHANGDLILWLGPKLMYTIGIKGFRFTSLQKIALLVATKKKYKNLVLHFGEIDCRVWSHKLQNMEQIDALTEKYLLRIDELAGLYGFAAVVLISPIPPNDGGHLNLDFPRSGSICERIQITKRMTQSMMSNSKNGSQKIVDSQSLVGYNASSHNYGSLREIYSIDGCHVNLEGAELIRRSIYGFLDSESRF